MSTKQSYIHVYGLQNIIITTNVVRRIASDLPCIFVVRAPKKSPSPPLPGSSDKESSVTELASFSCQQSVKVDSYITVIARMIRPRISGLAPRGLNSFAN